MDESVEEKENYTVKLQDLPEEFTFIVERFKDKGRSKGEDDMYKFVKSTFPINQPIGGIMISLTIESTILPMQSVV